ncbi:MAG: DUF4349 domain-containing protein [Actinomycetes bacterium]
MIKNLVRLVAVLGATLVLSACGAGNGQDSFTNDSSGAATDIASIEKGSVAYADPVVTSQQSIIRNADMALEVKDVAETVAELTSLIASGSGRIESSSLNAEFESSGASAYIVARIPEAKLDEVISVVSELGQRTSLNISTTDVTLQVIDLTARIDALVISRDRLSDLMAQATTTADLLAAEQALAQRQSELDAYQSQLDYLNSQVTQSTLSIQILSNSTSITSGLAGIGATLNQALRNFLQGFESVILFIGSAIPWVLVLSIFFITSKAVSRFVKKGKLKKSNKI